MFVLNQIKYHEEFEKGRMGGEALPPESNANRGTNQYMAAVLVFFPISLIRMIVHAEH